MLNEHEHDHNDQKNFDRQKNDGNETKRNKSNRIEGKEKYLLSRNEQQQEEIPNGKTKPESRNRLASHFSVL